MHDNTAATKHRMPSGTVSPSLRGNERSVQKEAFGVSGGVGTQPAFLKTVQQGKYQILLL